MGSLIHDNSGDVLIFGNLYISNNDRNPLFKGGARGAVVNNLMHNPGMYALTYSVQADEWEGHPLERGRIAAAGNVLRLGPSGRRDRFARLKGPCDVWFHDNAVIGKDCGSLDPGIEIIDADGKPSDSAKEKIVMMDKAPLWPDGLNAKPSAETKDWVLENAGARPWDRDAVDKRLIEEARTGGGKIIDSENEVGGYEAAGKPAN